MSFGRKGLDGAAPASADPMAARRAAFLAEERARAAAQPTTPAAHAVASTRSESAAQLVMTRVANVSEKSNGIAYLLWFFLCGVGAHRFYLGFTGSAVAQLMLAPLGYVLLFSKEPIGFIAVIGGGIWMLADAFLIPGMVRKANARARGQSLGPVFA